MKRLLSSFCCTILATGMAGSKVPAHAADGANTGTDISSARQPIVVVLAEQDYLLGEMHSNLATLTAVIGSLGQNDPRGAAKAAKSRGMGSYGDRDPNRPETLSAKLPPGWKPMASLLRRSFDELAAGIEARETTAQSLARVSQLMTICNACHTTYRLVVQR